jgi:hypothetical protein
MDEDGLFGLTTGQVHLATSGVEESCGTKKE